MPRLRRLIRRLRSFARRSDAYQEVADELQHYLEESAADFESRGLSPAEALRAARLQLGGSATGITEQVHRYGWENAVESLLTDVRYAGRRLAAEPGFTAVVVLTIAVGIGATTAMFSAVNSILLRSLPYPNAERVVSVWDAEADGARLAGTFGTFRELETRSRTLQELAVFRPWQPTLSGVEIPERLQGQRVTSRYFRLLDVPPARGRLFADVEDRPGGAAEVLLSDRLWRRRFGANPDILGQAITLDDRAHLVIGVMPPRFENVTAPAAELWALLQYDMSQGRAWGHHLGMLGRLRDDVSVDDAQQELERIAATPVPEQPRPPWASLEHGLSVTSLQEDTTAGIRPALLAVFGAAGLVLAIAGVNVANMLVARGFRRRREFAVRGALGAGRQRLIRQLLTESTLVALVGGLAGIGVAALAGRALLALSPPNLPRVEAISIDRTAYFFALAMTTLVGVAFGLLPAIQATRSNQQGNIENRFHGRAGGGGARMRDVLVVAEVALVAVLLVSSGLLLRSMHRLMAEDAGFAPSGLVTLQVQVSGSRYGDDGAVERFYDQALEVVSEVPGVESSAFTSQLPLSGDGDTYGVEVLSHPGLVLEDDAGAFRYAVSPDYAEAMMLPVRRGRWFEASDDERAPRVAVISESMVVRRFPGIDPIGARVRIGPPDTPAFTVVGVVGNVRQESLALADSEAVYIPSAQWHFADDVRSLVVRTEPTVVDADALVSALRKAIWSVDPGRPISRVATMDDLLATSVADRRFALLLFEAFALASLILAAAGIYGAHAAGVAERVGELGVRAALGASPDKLVAQVLRRALGLTAFGLLLGIVVSLGTTRALSSQLYAVSPLDAGTYSGVVLLVVAVAALACWIPAWRAARVDPANALRAS